MIGIIGAVIAPLEIGDVMITMTHGIGTGTALGTEADQGRGLDPGTEIGTETVESTATVTGGIVPATIPEGETRTKKGTRTEMGGGIRIGIGIGIVLRIRTDQVAKVARGIVGIANR